MDTRVYKGLIDKLSRIRKEDLQRINVVLLPDFFVDHTVYVNDLSRIIEDIKRVHSQGGGNIPGVKQDIHSGGNAANTALALARLGVKTHLISRTDELGLDLIRFYLGSAGVDVSHVKKNGRLSITTILELGVKHVNVMIGDPGSAECFSYDLLDDSDLELISEADLVGVMNWNLNRYGTNLAEKVFKYAKRHSVLTFFDSGDPAPKKNEIPLLMERLLSSNDLDIFSLNENELRHYTGDTMISTEKEMMDSAVKLKEKVKARLDLHTSLFAASVTDNSTSIVPAYKVDSVKRSTGAGDNWNAGDILGELLDLEPEERLLCANTVAACYITSEEPVPPSMNDIIHFLKHSIQ